VKITGATVHFVDEGTDTGPIILQKAVERDPENTSSRVSLARAYQELDKYRDEMMRSELCELKDFFPSNH